MFAPIFGYENSLKTPILFIITLIQLTTKPMAGAMGFVAFFNIIFFELPHQLTLMQIHYI